VKKIKEITVLRIKRTEAGKRFPFDIVYFFHKDQEETISKIFRSGIVMPITKTMKKDIKSICETTKPEVRLHTFDRNDAAELNENPLASILHKTSKDLMFVPILFTRFGRVAAEQAEKQAKRIFPLYLAANHRVTRAKNIASILSSRAYLLFGGGKIRPVCLACPMHMLAIIGRCEANLEDCYKQITHAAPSTFTRALKKYDKFASQLLAPEIKDKKCPDTLSPVST